MKKLILSAAIATVSLAAVAKDDLQYSKATEQALKSGKIAYFIESKKARAKKTTSSAKTACFLTTIILPCLTARPTNPVKATTAKRRARQPRHHPGRLPEPAAEHWQRRNPEAYQRRIPKILRGEPRH